MPLKTSANSLSTQLGRSSGLPARDVLTSLSFLATDNSVILTGCSPSVGTRAQYFRASLTRSAQMKAVRSRLLRLPVPHSRLDLLPPMKGLLVSQVFCFGLVVNPAAVLTLAIHFVLKIL